MRALSLSWLFAGTLGVALAGSLACGSEDSGSGSGAGAGTASCTPGQTSSCTCTNAQPGAQTCGDDGKYGSCQCEGGGGGPLVTCGNNKVDAAEECDDGNASNDDGCTTRCAKPSCGDGIVSAPEVCDDAGIQGGENDSCPDDCGCPDGDCGFGAGGGSATSTSTSTSTATATSSTGTSSCEPGQLLYAGSIKDQPSKWSEAGVFGTDAGDAKCKGIAADHICDYQEVLAAEARGELKALSGTAWIHRTTDAMVDGVMSKPGAGGRCNDWQYQTNHISDGEFVTFSAGAAPAYSLDNDTVYDGVDTSHAQAGLPCGGVSRDILCCYYVPVECQ